jgi:hypothetical protein
MQDYRAYVIGQDGHVLVRHEFWCVNDEEAKEHAKQFVDGNDIELWHHGKRIAIFHHEKHWAPTLTASACTLLHAT